MANTSKHMTSIINFAVASSKCNTFSVSTSSDNFDATILKQRLVI